MGESCILKNEFSDAQFGIIYDYQVVKAGGRLKPVVKSKRDVSKFIFHPLGIQLFDDHEFLWRIEGWIVNVEVRVLCGLN